MVLYRKYVYILELLGEAEIAAGAADSTILTGILPGLGFRSYPRRAGNIDEFRLALCDWSHHALTVRSTPLYGPFLHVCAHGFKGNGGPVLGIGLSRPGTGVRYVSWADVDRAFSIFAAVSNSWPILCMAACCGAALDGYEREKWQSQGNPTEIPPAYRYIVATDEALGHEVFRDEFAFFYRRIEAGDAINSIISQINQRQGGDIFAVYAHPEWEAHGGS